MLDNCTYNKAKLVTEISKLIGFIDRHGIEDADEQEHEDCTEELKLLREDLEEHLEALSAEAGLTKEQKIA